MSSSPAAEIVPSEEDRELQKKPSEQITFRFCQECSNMLYPKENKETSTLEYVCRHCFWTESATSACIFRNNLQNSVGEVAGVTQDIGSDPTVGFEDYSCTLCGEEDYFCTLCGVEIACTICGEGISGDTRGSEDEDESQDIMEDENHEELLKMMEEQRMAEKQGQSVQMTA